MSAHFYQDELKSEVAPAKVTEQRKGVSVRWMILPFLALLVASFNLGGAVATHSYTDTISGYRKLIGCYQQRVAMLSEESTPMPTPTSPMTPPVGKDVQNMPKPPPNRLPAGPPTGPAENVPPMAPDAQNPIPTMPPAPIAEGAPGPDNPGTTIVDPDC